MFSQDTFAQRVFYAAKGWHSDSGYAIIRGDQQSAKFHTFSALESGAVWGPIGFPPEADPGIARLWLFRVPFKPRCGRSRVHSQAPTLDDLPSIVLPWMLPVFTQLGSEDQRSVTVSDIMRRLAYWQLVAVDLLKHSVPGGAVCEVIQTDQGESWITVRSLNAIEQAALAQQEGQAKQKENVEAEDEDEDDEDDQGEDEAEEQEGGCGDQEELIEV